MKLPAILTTSETDRRAFSLMETLVVISLITMLMALLMPALGRAKYNARVVQCNVNVHSQWQAQIMLGDANAGVFWRHNDHSADYFRSNEASGSVWEAIHRGGYLSDGMVTICPVHKSAGGAWSEPLNARYVDPYWKEGDYAGWHAEKPQVVTTYMWFANFKQGLGVVPSGAETVFLDTGNGLEPTWPRTVQETNSTSAMITHRISGGMGYASFNEGHLGLGVYTPKFDNANPLADTIDQPVGFSDGHVISRPREDIVERTRIDILGIGYYWY